MADKCAFCKGKGKGTALFSAFLYIRLVADINGTVAANHRRQQGPDAKGPSLKTIYCAKKTNRESKHLF